jgi:hypothetical protein
LDGLLRNLEPTVEVVQKSDHFQPWLTSGIRFG